MNDESKKTVFEVQHHCYASSTGDAHDDFILSDETRGNALADLSYQDLVHLRDFLNDYICMKGGNSGREKTE